MANDYTGSYTGIAQGGQMRAADVTDALNQMEKVANKKDVINDNSTEYPSSKIIYELLPAGIILPYAGMSAPNDNWAVCDGRAVSRTTYSRLFSAISTVWGAGNGSTTFNIPDLRGATIRGVGTPSPNLYKERIHNGAETTAPIEAIALGQAQSDAIRNITGYFTSTRLGGQWDITNRGALYGSNGGKKRADDNDSEDCAAINLDASRVVPVASENKVKARGVNFIIKLV